MDINELAKKCLESAKKKEYKTSWREGGLYLHLEASELIEALRGKGNPIEEAGDVLYVLLRLMAAYNIKPSQAINSLLEKHNISKKIKVEIKSIYEADPNFIFNEDDIEK